jgi:hypothetical protein
VPNLPYLKNQLIYRARLYTWGDIVSSVGTLPPSQPGTYAWVFTGLAPPVPVQKCISRRGRVLLYVGIAKKNSKSQETLQSRICNHFIATAQQSTLRSTLGYILESKLGTVMRRVWPTGKSWTYAEAECTLSDWLENHASVSWIPLPYPDNENLEDFLRKTTDLPLNKQGNRGHPFFKTLDNLRKQAWSKARSLPIRRCVFECVCGQLFYKGNCREPRRRCPRCNVRQWAYVRWEDAP